MNFVQPNAELPLAGNPAIGTGGPAPATANTWGSGHSLPSLPADGLGLRGWAAAPRANGADFGGTLPGIGGGIPGTGNGVFNGQGGFLGLLNGIMNQISNLINQYTGEIGNEGAGSQTVSDGTFSSTGDPHLSENATILGATGNASTVNRKFDSMSSHVNLLSSQDFDGGFRISTNVTTPNANGVTLNANATVHMNSNLDNITLNNDGTFSVESDGNAVSVGSGQAVTLGGGETVTHNADGSLTVTATNVYGGSISTNLSAKDGGVNVTATVHNATVGGDIANDNAAGSAAPQAPVSTIGPLLATDPTNLLASATLAPTPNPSTPLNIGNDFEQFAANA